MSPKKTMVWLCVAICIGCLTRAGSADGAGDAASLEKEAIEKQISYALGYDVFEKLKTYFDLDPRFFIMGAEDGGKNQPRLTPEKIEELLMAYQQTARQRQMEEMKAKSDENRKNGSAFLEANGKKEGVVTLPSGLQYKIIKDGTGPLPKSTDTVECHYQGTLIDDTVFDSSYERGKPAVFQVGQVIKGWIEALQLMKTGSTWMLYIPPDLAYGDRGAGEMIQPGSTLVFKVELLGIVEP